MGGESQSQQDHDSEFFRNSGERESVRFGRFSYESGLSNFNTDTAKTQDLYTLVATVYLLLSRTPD